MISRDTIEHRPLLGEDRLNSSSDLAPNSHVLITKFLENIRSYAYSTVPAASRAKWIRNMLVSTLLEAGIVLGSTYGSYHFMEDLDDEGKNPFIVASLGLFLNFLLRTPNMPMKKPLSDAIRIARSFLFTHIDSMTRYTLFHEGGHALMAKALFKNPNPKITLDSTYFGVGGGKTSYVGSSGLSELGEKFGQDTSGILVTAAGAGEGMIESYLGLIVAQLIPDNFSEIKTHLRFGVLMHLMRNLSYALSAYDDCTSSHDFCNMDKKADLSPYAAMLFMVGTLLLLQLGLSITTRLIGCAKRKLCTNSITEEVDEENRLDAVSVTDEENQVNADSVEEPPRRKYICNVM